MTRPVPQADGAIDALAYVEGLSPAHLDRILRSVPHAVGDCCPLVHRFAPGIYAREITMPGGTIVLGRKHKTRHLNLISKGRVSFKVPDEPVQTVEAPFTFISEPGVQKMLLVHEETVWTTIHPTDETDLAKLDALLVEPLEPEPEAVCRLLP